MLKEKQETSCVGKRQNTKYISEELSKIELGKGEKGGKSGKRWGCLIVIRFCSSCWNGQEGEIEERLGVLPEFTLKAMKNARGLENRV